MEPGKIFTQDHFCTILVIIEESYGEYILICSENNFVIQKLYGLVIQI